MAPYTTLVMHKQDQQSKDGNSPAGTSLVPCVFYSLPSALYRHPIGRLRFLLGPLQLPSNNLTISTYAPKVSTTVYSHTILTP